mmetsp:Transcript_5591/g.8499  ORF Transcript_5591/g.8499 Transcript_5591/m.8499 type:complete len:88 (-) Transcript_5591:49-312(-)
MRMHELLRPSEKNSQQCTMYITSFQAFMEHFCLFRRSELFIYKMTFLCLTSHFIQKANHSRSPVVENKMLCLIQHMNTIKQMKGWEI